ncbi:uncharacterized protein LOC123666260 [Melitaea cinxia]|uniref:uncharacterized protein LOC123666260 n=1 Tax=Melitaea cinxia TaxID=113334 RepID=UPI001E26F2E2|nr:uncharacterized protein LOC123666260 [Melitaea cinxia]
MRFYLLYKNHGLYDPVLDDTELVYVPVTQEEWQASNNSEQTQNLSYSEKQNYEQRNGTNNENVFKTQAKETLDTAFQDQIRMNLKDTFTQIETEDLPPQARFKLPISDEYDPEGKKMSKLRRLYEKFLNIDLTKVLKQMKNDDNKTNQGLKDVKQDVINRDFNAEEIRKPNEMIKKDFMYMDENIENFTKETAVKIVEKSINKALSAQTKQKTKTQIKNEITRAEYEIHKESPFENFRPLNESKFQENERKSNYFKDEHKQETIHSSVRDKAQTKKVTFNVDEYKEEESFCNKTENDVTNCLETNGRLTPEKRKLLVQQDIEQVIQPGTVRDRSEVFRKYNIMNDVIEKSDYKYEKSNVKGSEHVFSKTKQAKKVSQQKAYKTGAQTILNIHRASCSLFSKVLLKSFLSQFTKFMILLSKFIQIKPEYYFKEEKHFKQRREVEHSSLLKEGELIVKKKLSGAKIAQIEGMKPVDLTDKMNVVILELQRMSGKEEELCQKEFDETEYSETDFEKMDFDKEEFNKNENYCEKYQRSSESTRPCSENKIDEDCKDSSYEYKTKFDEKQSKFHTYETTKTQSMEVREIRSEKRYSEYRSNKKESSPCNEVRTYVRDANGNIIYIAIVEAHVYTYKDAIFRDYMRRLSETKNVIEKCEINKQSDVTDSTNKIDIYVDFGDTRKLSLASTVMVPVEEYATVQEMENTKVNYIRSTTDLEHVAKKIAVQNITQVIEPLLKTEVDIYASKGARAEIQTPVNTIAEKTEIFTEQDQMFFQAQVYVTQKSYMSIEKPEKPAVEITEISIDEDNSEIIEEEKVKKEEPQTVIEPPVKSLAEISEVIINEDHVNEIVIPEPKLIKPSPTIDISTKSVAIVSEVAVDEANLGVLDVQKATTKTSNALVEKASLAVAETIAISPEIGSEFLNNTEIRRQSAAIDISKSMATEVLQVLFEEPINEEIKIAETEHRQSQTHIEQKFLASPVTTTILVEEPSQENLIMAEVVEKLPQSLIETSVLMVPETIAIEPAGPKDEYLEIPSEAAKQTKSSIESPSLTVAELLDTLSIGPKEGEIEVNEISLEKPNIGLDVLKSFTTTVVFLEDQHDELQVPKIDIKAAQTELESPHHILAEVLTIIPEGLKEGNLVIDKTSEEEIRVNFNKLHSVETTSVSLGDTIKDILPMPKIIEQQPQLKIQENKLNIAETLLLIPEEPKDQEFNVATVKTQEARINIEEFKAAETEIITCEEIANENLDLPEIIKKEVQTSIVSCPLAVAETVTTSSIESATEVGTQIILEKALKSIEKDVKVALESVTPISHTIITSIEETNDLSEKLKLCSQSANVTFVESSAATIAETTAVTAAKEEAFRTFDLKSRVKIREIPIRKIQDVKTEDIELNYTVELPKDEEVNEVFAEVTLTKQKSPPVEVFAEYEVNEKKTTEVDSSIFESIKLLKKHVQEFKSMDENFSYTALISDVQLEKKVEEELLEILQSSKIEDITNFTFPSPTLIPIIQEYLFRLRGPKLRTFKHMEDVFEEATLRLKSKYQTATVQSFDTSLTLILQDIADSQLHPEAIEVAMETTERISEKDSTMQYFDSKKISRSLESSVHSSEIQSLHTEVAVARAATKQTIETGIDVSVLSIEEEPIVESRRRMSTAQRTKKTMKSAAIESDSVVAESESAIMQISDANQSQMYDKTSLEAESRNARLEINDIQAASDISRKSNYIQSKKAAAFSVATTSVDEENALERSNSSTINESSQKLEIRADLTADESEVITNGFTPSPPLSPPTPLTDEYIFKFDIPLPRITRYVERDCSYSPESIEDDIILKCGYIPHIITRIERIIYSPPLPTPPASPERQIVPIYKKPGLKGGSGDYRSSNISLFKYFC